MYVFLLQVEADQLPLLEAEYRKLEPLVHRAAAIRSKNELMAEEVAKLPSLRQTQHELEEQYAVFQTLQEKIERLKVSGGC
jgi:hypothetical protein